MAYEPKKILVIDYNKNLAIQLEERISALPEMTVRAEPIIRNGDTLIFDLEQHRIASDENLENILERLPGVTVESNGTIYYDGLPISKFYVEGLDLLEGKYKIITRNLKIDAIRDIEIIEHHQPIQALDSIVRPPEAAINLKLKSNIAITGAINTALGVPKMLYAGRLDVFGFQKKSQFNLLVGANNIGDQQGANFENLYVTARTNRIELPPLSLSQLAPPLIDHSHYLLNQEKIIGLNYLRKIGKFTQLKW